MAADDSEFGGKRRVLSRLPASSGSGLHEFSLVFLRRLASVERRWFDDQVKE